jgi:hypothetical protein
VTADLTTIERAIELAKSGRCASIDDIRRVLKAERYEAVDANLSGHFTKRQLVGLMTQARSGAKK